MSHVEVIRGGCQPVMRSMEADSVDAIVTDPPYSDTSLKWDVLARDWLTEARRVLKPSGSLWCFGSLRFFMNQAGAFEFAGLKLSQDIVWEKHNGSNFHADRFKRVHEHAVQFYRSDAAWADVYKNPVYTADATARTVRRKQRPPHTGHIEASSYTSIDGGPRLQRSVLHVRSCHGYAEHPTQKPIAVLIPLIEYSCPPEGLVLDCFAGVGSVGRAAKDCGRSAVLVEIDEDYCRIARERLRQEILPIDAPREASA